MEIIIRTERTMEDFFLESSYEIIDLSVLTAHCYRDHSNKGVEKLCSLASVYVDTPLR